MKTYDGLTDYDIKHIIDIQDDTTKLLSYVNYLVLLHHNLDYDTGYDKGYEDGLAGGYSVGSYVHYSILDED